MTIENYNLYKVTAECEGVKHIMYYIGNTLSQVQRDYTLTNKSQRVVSIESVCRVNWVNKDEY